MDQQIESSLIFNKRSNICPKIRILKIFGSLSQEKIVIEEMVLKVLNSLLTFYSNKPNVRNHLTYLLVRTYIYTVKIYRKSFLILKKKI